jgi:RHS repeat-associated protein
VADENPGALGIFEFPLRFPGQYFDKESNLAYNFFRDYDPVLGRYVESDPTGLRGGLNTYLYASGTPVVRIDPLGLVAQQQAMGNIPAEASERLGQEQGILCGQVLPCGLGAQLESAAFEQCKVLLPVVGGTKGTVAPVAYNACMARCPPEYRKRCGPKTSCAPDGGVNGNNL